MVCCWYAVSLLQYYDTTRRSFTSLIYFFFSSFNSSENPNIQGPIYFNRTDVKKAINAPLDVEWTPCAVNSVFNTTDGDESLPPAFTVLPSVIEKNLRTVIVHGLADYVLIAEGFVRFFFFFLRFFKLTILC
jgi:Serine carboxypeptidase